MITPQEHVSTTGETTYKIRFRGPRAKGGHGPTSQTFTSRAQAVRFAKWLDALGPQGALDKLWEADQADRTPTLDEVAADHIAHLTGIEHGTRLTYERLWARTWSPLLGQLPADHIGPDLVARAVNALGATYSHKSLQNQRGLLSGVLDRAIREGYLKENPARGIRLPRGHEGDRAEMRILTPDDFADVIERVPEHYRPLLRFLFGTGARWGEAVALEAHDVTLPAVRIRRALKWSPDNRRLVGATKTRKSNRTVIVGQVGELADDLTESIAGKASGDLVFTAPRGGPILHRTFWSRVWLPAVSHLEPRPRIHDLRHSHASWLLANNVPIHVVQARLGHESIQTTVDTYGHLVPDAQVAAASAAQLALGSR